MTSFLRWLTLLLVSLHAPALAAGDRPPTTRDRVQATSKVADAAGTVAKTADGVHGIATNLADRQAELSYYLNPDAHAGLATRAEQLAGQRGLYRGAATAVGAIATTAEVGAFTYDMVNCIDHGANCLDAAATALQYGSQQLADKTLAGAIASRTITGADAAWSLVDPKGRSGMAAIIEDLAAPHFMPALGYEFVPGLDGYATHKQAVQFRHMEQVEQARVQRELREAFNPVYTPRDGGSEFDPLAAFLDGMSMATAGCGVGTAIACASPDAEEPAVPQVNECDHPGHDPTHLCDASGRTISRGGIAQ